MANDKHQLIEAAENANEPGISAARFGTRITVEVNVDNVTEVMEAGFNRLILERSTNLGLSWQEVTTPDQRRVLAQDKIDYTLYDRGGDPTYLYRTRFIDTRKNPIELSEPSDPIEGAGLALLGILTVRELKQRYFFGVNITDDAGEPLPDAVFRHYILQAIRWFEHQIDIAILPTQFSEQHDYYRSDYNAFNLIQLDNSPVISIESFTAQYPSGQNIVEYPTEWLRLNKESGQVQIVPTAGTLSEVMIGEGGSFLPAVYNGMPYLPQLWSVQYTAGFEAGKVPRNIIDVIGMFASLGPFNIFGDLIAGAGIATLSLSMDGLSQSIGTTSSATNAGYGARIIQYLKQIKEQIPILRRYYAGPRMVVA